MLVRLPFQPLSSWVCQVPEAAAADHHRRLAGQAHWEDRLEDHLVDHFPPGRHLRHHRLPNQKVVVGLCSLSQPLIVVMSGSSCLCYHLPSHPNIRRSHTTPRPPSTYLHYFGHLCFVTYRGRGLLRAR